MSYESSKLDDLKVVSILKKGGIGLLPTDTIYGLSCSALNESAVLKIHELKKRDKNKPLIVLISAVNQLKDLGIGHAGPVATKYWPGSVTVILSAKIAPHWLHRGTKTLAVRLPAFKELTNLISKIGPIVSTSANIQGYLPAGSASQAKEFFGEQLDFYVDIGELPGDPSTIVQPMQGKLKILRQGKAKIKKEDLYDV